MKDRKFYLVSGLLVLISIFIILFTWFKFVDLSFAEKISKEVMIASIGLIGTIVGGIVSGGLTLLGVKLTIDFQLKKEAQGKNASAKYLFTEMLPYLIDINEVVKCMTAFNINESLVKLNNPALKLIEIAKENYSRAIQINIDFYRNMKTIEYHAKEIVDYLETDNEGKTDQQIIRDLMVIRNNLAICDQQFDVLIRDI